MRFHRATGLAPTTSRNWANVVRRDHTGESRFPTAAVLRHFDSFRAAWSAAGVQLADERWAPWTAEHDRFLLTQLGVLPTVTIAVMLGRGEPAVRSRARKLGVRVGTARGWPLLRAARTAGLSESILRASVARGELRAFKGAKHVYVDPADLVDVPAIDWPHPPRELEAAVRFALRVRLVRLLTDRSCVAAKPFRSAPG
jgi:hypothetical protein